MKERLNLLRKTLKMNQKEFGIKLGVDGSSISNMETGRFNITETMIKLICSTYNVNEPWLRSGEGEMFVSDPDIELARLVADLSAEEGSVRYKFIVEMMKLDDDAWALVNDFILKVCSED